MGRVVLRFTYLFSLLSLIYCVLAGPQGYIPYPHRAAVCTYVLAGCPAFARPYEGVHRRTSLMSSSLLLQQCPGEEARRQLHKNAASNVE